MTRSSHGRTRSLSGAWPDRYGLVASRHCSDYKRKECLRVRPPGFDPQACGGEQIPHAPAVMLTADLGADRLSFPERHQPYAWHPDFVLSFRNQMHLDPVSD